ncbi:glycosyltransferase [Actinopolyspora lacussalsi]|nr:glycosyltransferase family 2 protein [Actinopolyspora righensis]
MNTFLSVLHAVAVGVVFLGAVPLVSALAQFLLVGLHRWRGLYRDRRLYLPRTTVVIPAWNESNVLRPTIEALLGSDYPASRLRVLVVDDASTDSTAELMAELTTAHPDRVTHLRREHGGQGKAHTLNHGLREVLRGSWAEAVLVTDADVRFDPDALWRMTRQLSDPAVGAVCAYIKEGSGRHGNYVNRYIGFEYVTAQAAARRSQNVIGAVACLAGGAQLHSRHNLADLGGRFDTETLAEDTVTTFETQLAGNRVVFDGCATVRAEEPGTLTSLWKQRLRWSRGNLQVTRRYARLWFRGRATGDNRLGSWLFGLVWFSLLLTPALMVASSCALLFLLFTDSGRSWFAFHALWVINLASYLFTTLLSLVIDRSTARRCWREALIFPGVISVLILIVTAAPNFFVPLFNDWGLGLNPDSPHSLMGFVYSWLALAMPIAWLAKLVESTRLRPLAPVLIQLTGYGSLLAACTVAAFVSELRHSEQRWDKTEKAGLAGRASRERGGV